jgi:hypothetical protein
MKRLLPVLAFLSLCGVAVAQNEGLATDTNGTVISQRSGDLTLTNGLRLGTLTNAATRIATIGTNGAVGASTGVPSGSSVRGSVIAGDGASSSAFTRTLESGVITNSGPFTISQTWSNAAALFTGFAVTISNATNTNASRLMFLSVNGRTNFLVREPFSGATYVNVPSELAFFGQGNATPITFGFTGNPSPSVLAPFLGATGDLTVGAGTFGSGSVIIRPVGSGRTTQFRNGTNEQWAEIYGTWSATNNYRRLSIGMSNNGIGFIRPEQSGPSTNTNRFIYISGLPTNNPGVSGVLWNSNGSVVVSP